MPPRSKKPTGPTPVDATVHQDKRTNIPTADAQEFTPEPTTPTVWWAERDRDLDPQLVWKGKDDQNDILEVPAPPIYIQEKIDPRVLVENLRTTSTNGAPEPELTLFDSFDGLDELDLVDFYQHQANWSNRMVLGDSLQVMASLAEREALRGQVQMIYFDPPYGIKFGSNWQVSTRKRDVKDGKLEDASFEVEQIKAFRDTWELGIHSYLAYLRDRLTVARDLLTDSGSIFVQIGDENVHLVRSVLDEVFGSEHFVSQIVFKKTGGQSSTRVANVVDFILWYGKSDTPKFRQLFNPRTPGEEGSTQFTMIELPSGERRSLRRDELRDLPDGELFQHYPLVSDGSASSPQPFEFEGRVFTPSKGSHWKVTLDGLRTVETTGRLVALGNTLRFVNYMSDYPVTPTTNIWLDTQTSGFAADRWYVVQTHRRVIERCMLMATDPGDLVLDPTCGSGTTAAVAEQWGRRWITIDTSRVALALARQRLMGAKFPYYLMADSPEGQLKEADLTSTPPSRDATYGDIRRGFVYERVQHITLKSIANNPDIREGMSREEIDAAIKRHADFELLYDKPYEDKHKVRVTGPFTVESLSPHRSLAFSGQAPDPDEVKPVDTDSDAGFEPMILENLARAGIQNGRRNERLTFATIEPHAGTFVQALGDRSGDDGAVRKVAVSIGPQYGTVDAKFIKGAAREALAADGVELLAVLAFAFDPLALGANNDAGVSTIAASDGFADVAAERSLGRLPVLLVRMNNDLVMGDELKKTGAGNLFTVFGEPDIAITTGPGADGTEQVTVEILGVDVYDPTTGEVRSGNTDFISLWMIDTDYNDESFFVRHCYFTGGNDPYARLKKALKADIDEDAWASLYRTVSRPFPKPTTGKIAVKVINDYGDEVMQVFEVN